MDNVKGLFSYIEKSTSCFHAIEELVKRLNEEGFSRLYENKDWDVMPGGKYYVTRNSSSIIAFKIPESGFAPFKITATHSDYPTFKVKENAELYVADKYVKLNTEGYGGSVLSTWIDRPLSIAGRVIVETETGIEERLIDFDRDLLMIPGLAIHMNREVNNGVKFSKQVDMLPLWGSTENCKDSFKAMIAEQVGTTVEKILGSELYLYNRMKGTIWGAKNEYASAPRIDNLGCTFACYKGFIDGESQNRINVFSVFDNEEEGSLTKQGADSTFLYDTLKRIAAKLGASEEDYYKAVADGMMVSADNGHAVHPNHAEKTDATTRSFLNGGVMIKHNAAQKYTTDGISDAYFRKICNMAGAKYQFFANNSDVAGGSTLGRISSAHVSINMVDIGMAQLAMHSSYETMGVYDLDETIKAIKTFYDVELDIKSV